ncbi:MAG TPA: LLM class F420-dependent oxidoreductase, partial [Mycobacterium sp.]|nr:LLM class F420-dependent oxidoreductase [Mycobacterium sp.]
GNTAAARQRVVRHGDGWCPFPAPPGLAQTARTAAIDSLERLGEDVDDLRRRFDAAGRDWSPIDIIFSNFEGGSPADDDFSADAYLEGVRKLEALGVTWLNVAISGDSLQRALESIERFGSLVIHAA